MIKLSDGRDELWQWDTGREVEVPEDCSEVHFSNNVIGNSIDVEVVDGRAIIPDVLLQVAKPLTAWGFVGTAEQGFTKVEKTFVVNRKNKPYDYVFTKEDQITLEEMLQRIEKVEEETRKGHTFTSKVTVTDDNSIYEKCIFMEEVLSDAESVTFINCVFHAQVTVNKKYAKFDNCVFEGENGGYMSNSGLVINKEAVDGTFNNCTIKKISNAGVVNKSHGWNFSNFIINNCQMYGMFMRDGGFQIQNGRICLCGTRSDTNCGGLYISPEGNIKGNIPEVIINGLSVQQNYGFGIKMEKVVNSYVNAVLLANNANICGGGVNDPPVDEVNGVCQSLFENSNGVTYRHYGMQLVNCRNVSGNINGVSCHKYWYGADLGYYDNIPSQNNIDVTWQSVYTDEHTWKDSHLFFAKFLPSVRAEIVEGLRIGSEYTEKDLRFAEEDVTISDGTSTFEGFTNDIDSIGADGNIVENSKHTNRLRLYLPFENDASLDVRRKGAFRLYVEAPELNIYPYVRLVGKESDPWKGLEHNGSKLAKYHRSGQNSVWSGVLTYDVETATADNLDVTNSKKPVPNTAWSEKATIRYLELRIIFNKADELPEGTIIKPKVRIEYLRY